VGQASTFGLFSVTTFISGSHMLTILRNPSPRPPWCWQSQRPLAVPLPSLAFDRLHRTGWDEGYTCPRSFAPRQRFRGNGFPDDARPGRIPVADHRVESCNIAVSTDDCSFNSYLHNFVSHPNGWLHPPGGLQRTILSNVPNNNDATSEFEPRLAGSGASRG
jgi:hypothetical protein